jgi:hypothetical protein
MRVDFYSALVDDDRNSAFRTHPFSDHVAGSQRGRRQRGMGHEAGRRRSLFSQLRQYRKVAILVKASPQPRE